MRITLCVDALEPQPGGIGRYTWKLCEGLCRRKDISPLLFFGRRRLIDNPARLLRGEQMSLGGGPERVYRSWRARRALRSSLVHGPNYFLPELAETGVITVHDLSVFRYPDMHPRVRVEAFERLFTSSLLRAAHVITDTETVRRELVDMFCLPLETVTAVPLGVDQRFSPRDASELAPALAQWGLTEHGYGLCVSALEPRKKVGELIKAWRLLPALTRDRYPLVLAGGPGWRNSDLHEEIRVATAEGWLRMLGFVDEARLPELYAGAALFIYPSIYEGFGLPPLEAMASGVPVIVSGRSCLPEVCGDAARFVDPNDIAGFSSEIVQVLSDADWRRVAIARGLEQSRQFTWERCVGATVDVYAKAMAKMG